MVDLRRYAFSMKTITSKSKLTNSKKEVEVDFEVFRDTNRYISPEIYIRCSKTAYDIAVYIIMTISHNQTSIKFNSTDIANSKYVKTKGASNINNAIKELINIGAIARWKDIYFIPNKDKISKNWYLLNPQMLKYISCRQYKEQVEVSARLIESNNNFIVHEFSAIGLDFKDYRNRCNITNEDLEEDNIIEESQFINCIKSNNHD